jgi:hypothetical protein
MSEEVPYRLIGWNVETGQKVLGWPTVAPDHYYTAGEIIVLNTGHWKIVGVRSASTKRLQEIDLQRE